MVEYQGRCDENKVAVGHAPKVLTEYYDFIKDSCDVSIFAPNTIFDSITDLQCVKKETLPHYIEMKGSTPFVEKITNKINMFKNIKQAIMLANKNGAGTIWFFNVEYYIMLYFLFHKKPSQKIVLTMFIDGYFPGKNASIKSKIVNGVKQKVFENAQKKFDLIISTGKSFSYKNCKNLFIPDYYYIPDVYDQFIVSEKESTAVCLGTMGRGKQLKEMVEAFNRIGYKLIIAGRFYDKNLVNDLKKIAKDNITIEDKFLTTEEYLSLLSKAKYTVLPYPEENYSHQTSGVMQEAIFLRTVPVTYESILDGNCVKGIGFKNWDSLTKEMLSSDTSQLVNIYENEIKTTYAYDVVKNKYISIFMSQNL